MNILITGGCGFIGSHLCKRLLNEGHRITCVDDLSSGSMENIADLAGHERFTFLKHDITEPLDIEADRIYNLACPASPAQYQADPVQTARTCVLGAIHMLELAVRNGARILQASTSEIYGDPLVHPQREDYRGNVNPIGIRSCYDEGKRMAETLFFDYHRQKGADIRVVRIFNTYGPQMLEDDGRVVSNFIVAALAEKDITVFGDGSQTRSFCYVSDTVDALIRMMEKEVPAGEPAFTGPVNIGNPNELTIRELAEKILRLTGSASRVTYCDLPSDDPTRRRPDITLAQEALGWGPSVSLDDGLTETIRYFAKKTR
ncbi:MAG: SDR family oxidoreductase [Lachnospiraceae bacterium]|nr:SDR family oxidoreductase [Lachnospiraceae bacterium]MBQ1514909.1 SDR family oxidoreductase [Lachnospiraceae bacterium]MBQ3400604.1 SDR family oxidoreductase [Lachnospiraceae bacterium]